MILRNSAKCPNCHEEIVSEFRHDYKSCSCGAISVDGGFDYLRRTYETGVVPEDTSIFYPCTASDQNGRRGVICGFYLVYGPDVHGDVRYYGARYYWGWDLDTGGPWECRELIDPKELDDKCEGFWQSREFEWERELTESVTA